MHGCQFCGKEIVTPNTIKVISTNSERYIFACVLCHNEAMMGQICECDCGNVWIARDQTTEWIKTYNSCQKCEGRNVPDMPQEKRDCIVNH